MQAKGKKNVREEKVLIWRFDADSVYMRQDIKTMATYAGSC
jgi:hypothetical protein